MAVTVSMPVAALATVTPPAPPTLVVEALPALFAAVVGIVRPAVVVTVGPLRRCIDALVAVVLAVARRVNIARPAVLH